jgi:hypothetical protein
MHSGKTVYSPVLEQQHAPTRISPSSSILSTSVLVRDFVCVRTGGAGDGEASGRRGFLAESAGAGDLDEAFERELRALTVGAIAPRIQGSRRLRLGRRFADRGVRVRKKGFWRKEFIKKE